MEVLHMTVENRHLYR